MSIKAVIVSPEFPPLTNWGGVATFNQNLAYLLTEIADEVHVITLGPSESTERIAGINIHYTACKTKNRFINFLYYKYPFGIIRRFLQSHFPLLLLTIEFNLFAFFIFRKLHKKEHFKFVHTPTYHAPAFLIKIYYKNVTLVNHIQGPQEFLSDYEQKSFDISIKARIENFYIKMTSDIIVCCSSHIENKVVARFPKLKSLIHTSHNFIPTDLVSTNWKSQGSGLINKNRLVFYGRIEYRKGPDLLLKSFIKLAKKNKKLEVYFIGQKVDNFKHKGKLVSFDTMLQDCVRDKELLNRIFIFSRIDDKKSLNFLLDTINGISVFPSRYEPFGFVVVESMYNKSLTLFSFQGASKELISDQKNGFIFPLNSNALAKVILKVQQLSKKQISEIQDLAFETVKVKFSILAALSFYKKLYDSDS
jgi:glycosyltransferase involved in cell wall biosynthesis